MALDEPRRMRPARVVIPVVLVLLVVLAISVRACQSNAQLSQDEAVAIATDNAGFAVVEHQVRFVRQGVGERPAWVVGVKAADGAAKTFVIDAGDGSIARVEQTAG